jgi:hypothetical protein
MLSSLYNGATRASGFCGPGVLVLSSPVMLTAFELFQLSSRSSTGSRAASSVSHVPSDVLHRSHAKVMWDPSAWAQLGISRAQPGSIKHCEQRAHRTNADTNAESLQVVMRQLALNPWGELSQQRSASGCKHWLQQVQRGSSAHRPRNGPSRPVGMSLQRGSASFQQLNGPSFSTMRRARPRLGNLEDPASCSNPFHLKSNAEHSISQQKATSLYDGAATSQEWLAPHHRLLRNQEMWADSVKRKRVTKMKKHKWKKRRKLTRRKTKASKGAK